jgi:hypothetical protein
MFVSMSIVAHGPTLTLASSNTKRSWRQRTGAIGWNGGQLEMAQNADDYRLMRHSGNDA